METFDRKEVIKISLKSYWKNRNLLDSVKEGYKKSLEWNLTNALNYINQKNDEISEKYGTGISFKLR
jgi:hypothetical protein